MRKFLLATSAAALALTFSGQAHAELAKTPAAAATVAPPQTTTTDGLVFSKDADQAKPIDQPAEPAAAQPEAKPAEQAAPAMVTPTLNRPDPERRRRRRRRPAARPGRKQASQFVPHEQDRAGVLAFYRDRNFAPLWIAAGKPAPRAEQAADFLHGVAADGLDPADYPTPAFGNADPAKLAADELALTNSVVTFARHASIGRVAFTRVSGAVYFDQKAPDAADVLGKLAGSTDVRATLDAFNPQSAAIQGAEGASSPRSAAARPPSRSEPKPEPEGCRRSKPKKGKHRAKRSRRPETASRRPRAPTPSSPTWSAGAGCRMTSARPM